MCVCVCVSNSDRHFGYHRLFSFHYFNIIIVVVVVVILTAAAVFIARAPIRFSSNKTVFFSVVGHCLRFYDDFPSANDGNFQHIFYYILFWFF